jgi:hypothetical protein
MAQARRPLPDEDDGAGDLLDGQTPELISPEPPEAPEPPSGTVIKFGGREFTVDPEVAAEFERYSRENDRKFGDQGRELGQLRTSVRQMEERMRPKPEADVYDNVDTELFQNPRQTLERLGRELEQRVISQVTSQNEAREEQRRNWDRFYKENSDLVDDDRLVRAIGVEMMSEREWRGTDDVRAFLAEAGRRTREELLRISRKGREAGATTQPLPGGRRPAESGGGGRRTPAQPTEEPSGPEDMLNAIMQSQDRRRAARRRAVAE